jgi:hypothetical protein
MKTMIVALLILVTSFIAVAQVTQTVIVSIPVGTKPITSCVLVSGSNVFAKTDGLGSPLDTGMSVWGVGVPYGAVIEAIYGTGLNDSIRISKTVTASGTVTLCFGVFNYTTYAAGDNIGIPMAIGNYSTIYSALLVDSSDAMPAATPADIHFFDAEPTFQQDSAQVNYPGADQVKFAGEMILPTASDIGSFRYAVPNRNTTEYGYPLYLNRRPNSKTVWVKLIGRGTWTPVLTMTALTLKLTVGR